MRFSGRRRLARGKQTEKTSRITLNKPLRAILSFVTCTGNERNKHIQRASAAFLCAFWLSSLHTCHQAAQGPAVCAGRPEEPLTGLLACRWCQVTRAGAAGHRWRRVAAAVDIRFNCLFSKFYTKISRGKLSH